MSLETPRQPARSKLRESSGSLPISRTGHAGCARPRPRSPSRTRRRCGAHVHEHGALTARRTWSPSRTWRRQSAPPKTHTTALHECRKQDVPKLVVCRRVPAYTKVTAAAATLQRLREPENRLDATSLAQTWACGARARTNGERRGGACRSGPKWTQAVSFIYRDKRVRGKGCKGCGGDATMRSEGPEPQRSTRSKVPATECRC